MEYTFTVDWFSPHIKIWERQLNHLKNKNINVLEIGSHEGRSAVWLLNNIIGKEGTLTCIDSEIGDILQKNLEKHENVMLVEGNFFDVLCSLNLEEKKYDLIYIDGDHSAKGVIKDTILCYELLSAGGILIFDDYLWKLKNRITERPYISIQSFLRIYADEIEIIHKKYQVFIRKKKTL